MPMAMIVVVSFACADDNVVSLIICPWVDHYQLYAPLVVQLYCEYGDAVLNDPMLDKNNNL